MKYCKRCGVLYSDLLESCPKCGSMPEGGNDAPTESDPKTVRKQWVAILVGIPLLILVLYLAGWLIRSGFHS